MRKVELDYDMNVISISESRRTILGRLNKKDDKSYHFQKKPFTILPIKAQEDVCYMIKDLGDW